MAERQRFFGIEGGDGSGKGTQTRLLTEALQAEGYEVYPLSFPQYGKRSATIVEKYLRGEFGAVNSVAAELASAAFALDRAAAKPELEHWLASHPNGIALADRYVLSNLAHQGTKIADKDERYEFYQELLDLEFGDLQLPRPNKNVILLVPPEVAQENVDKKAARSYTTAKRDIHEADPDHLRLANRNYRELAELFPDFAVPIEAYDLETRTMRNENEVLKEIRDIFGI